MKIARETLDELLAHAEATRPEECCGVLLASNGRIEVVLRAENEAVDGTRAFRLGRRAHLQAVRMECGGEGRIAAYYHSHPEGPERPSRRDADLAVPGTIHVILGLGGGAPQAAAWRWTGRRFEDVPLEVVEHGVG